MVNILKLAKDRDWSQSQNPDADQERRGDLMFLDI